MHLTLALSALCGKAIQASRENSRSLVQKLWRTELPCGKGRKKREKFLATDLLG
jgi:hypothetical protein